MASLEFDQGVNALYLRLRRGKVSSSEPLADNMVLDLDARKNVVGLELLLPATVKKSKQTGATSEQIDAHFRRCFSAEA